MIPFEFEADLGFFTQLLCRDGETLDDYAELFDFSLPAVKRAAVAKIRSEFASSCNPRCSIAPEPARLYGLLNVTS
jgi:hypothetical protein